TRIVIDLLDVWIWQNSSFGCYSTKRLFGYTLGSSKREFTTPKRDFFDFWVVWVKSNEILCNVKTYPNASSCEATIPSFCGK
ncbi:hypothetical protein A2U01_0064973, partial [Trifolium medium]|nr:hypothetical protein [Trifolium medium]